MSRSGSSAESRANAQVRTRLVVWSVRRTDICGPRGAASLGYDGGEIASPAQACRCVPGAKTNTSCVAGRMKESGSRELAMTMSEAGAPVTPAPKDARTAELADAPHPLIAGIGQALCVVVPLVVWFAPLSLAAQ